MMTFRVHKMEGIYAQIRITTQAKPHGQKSGTRLALANKIGESEELLFEEPTQVLEIMNDLTVSKIVGS